MNLIFICSEKTSFSSLFENIQTNESTRALRRFAIIDANVDSPNVIFQKLSNEIGVHQPQSLRLPNDAITFGSSDPLKDLYEKYIKNKNEGTCIIVVKEPEKCLDYFKKEFEKEDVDKERVDKEHVDVSKIELFEITEKEEQTAK